MACELSMVLGSDRKVRRELFWLYSFDHCLLKPSSPSSTIILFTWFSWIPTKGYLCDLYPSSSLTTFWTGAFAVYSLQFLHDIDTVVKHYFHLLFRILQWLPIACTCEIFKLVQVGLLFPTVIVRRAVP